MNNNVTLSNCLELYLPYEFLHSKGTKLIARKEVVEVFKQEVIESFIKLAGGLTESTVTGYYLNQSNNKMFKIGTFVLSVSYNGIDCFETAKYYANSFKEMFCQECVMIKCNGVTYMI